MSEPDYRREVASWIHHGRRDDGLPAHVLGIDALRATFAPWAIGRIDTGSAKADLDTENLRNAPAVGVLLTREDTTLAWLEAGVAVARMGLRASGFGVRVSYYFQPIQFPAFRQELKRATRSQGFPQVVIRLGYAPEGVATPRRPLEDVLVERRHPEGSPIPTCEPTTIQRGRVSS